MQCICIHIYVHVAKCICTVVAACLCLRTISLVCGRLLQVEDLASVSVTSFSDTDWEQSLGDTLPHPVLCQEGVEACGCSVYYHPSCVSTESLVVRFYSLEHHVTGTVLSCAHT